MKIYPQNASYEIKTCEVTRRKINGPTGNTLILILNKRLYCLVANISDRHLVQCTKLHIFLRKKNVELNKIHKILSIKLYERLKIYFFKFFSQISREFFKVVDQFKRFIFVNETKNT